MESVINMVRTTAPLTSEKTISKINTYLPPLELMSTLIGMYSFLNKAQNFTPIRPLKGNTPMDKISALVTNGNLPIAKMMAQPLIANNMDKIMLSLAKNAIGNGNINDLLSSMSKQFPQNQGNSNNNTDLSSLMETFMPLINNIMSSQSNDDNNNNDSEDNNNFNDFEMDDVNTNIEVDEYAEKTFEEDVEPIHIENNIIEEKETNKDNNMSQPKNTPIKIRHRRRDPRQNKRMI